MTTGPTVTVSTYRRARELIGTKTLERSLGADATVGGLLDDLAEDHGIDPAACIVMVNGEHVRHRAGSATALADGDEVTVAMDPTRD